MAEKFTDKLQKIEDGVVGTYQKIEGGVTSAYQKVEDKFINTFIARGDETIEEAKARIVKGQENLEAKAAEDAKKRAADLEARMAAQNEMIKKSIEASQNAGKR